MVAEYNSFATFYIFAAMSQQDFSGYFHLNCNFFKIYRYVPGIADALISKSLHLKNLNSDEDIEELLRDGAIRTDDAASLNIPAVYTLPNVAFTESDVEGFKSKFKKILNKTELKKYNLISELDNLVVLCLHLYETEWDTEKYSFDALHSTHPFESLAYNNKPPSYLNLSKAQELARFLKIYYHDVLYPGKTKAIVKPSLTLKLGSQEAVIKDNALYNFSSRQIISGLQDKKISWQELNETFGEIGAFLTCKVKSNMDQDELIDLKNSIERVLNESLISPFPLRNAAICRFCLILKQYLNKANLFPMKPNLPEPMLMLFAEVLNLFNMKFISTYHYMEKEYRANLSRTIRDHFKMLLKNNQQASGKL